MDLLTSISAKDIVDILIVSYVIYKLILVGAWNKGHSTYEGYPCCRHYMGHLVFGFSSVRCNG
jgi:hypothetical protein